MWITIVTLVAALGFGIWLGLPRRYDQSLDDIEERLSDPSGHHGKAKRHFTFLGFLQPRSDRARQRRRRGRQPFKLD